MRSGLVITIDGPAGAGKSTVSKALAAALGYLYVDTGAMYRAVGVLAKDAGNPLDDRILERVCSNLHLELKEEGDRLRVWANGRDVSEEIRRPEIGQLASAVSTRPVVRAKLKDIQRRLGSKGGVVLEGRDMGTVVFPDADLKFFLDARPEVRAKRRYEELRAKGLAVTLQEVAAELEERDRRDRQRQLAPLQPAADAVVIDSSDMTVDEVVACMRQRVEEALAGVATGLPANRSG